MKIIVDGDACPGIHLIDEVAKKYSIPLILYCDIYHDISLNYGQVKRVDSGFQSVDMYILNNCESGDVIITQDYGVASVALNKKCLCLNPRGFLYTNENIDKLLFERYLSNKIRKDGAKLKGCKKRSKKDDDLLMNLLVEILKNNR